MRIAISFDYDSPTGYRQSFNNQHASPTADMEGTDALLEVLRRHQVLATFGVVGMAGTPGVPPEHCPQQVRAIRQEGHEVASHSMHHRYIPSMSGEELLSDAKQSREVLEACCGGSVVGFIPPFNRPMQFPLRGALSLSELFGLHGRGHGRQTIGSMLASLRQAGFTWCRVSYSNKFAVTLRYLGIVGNGQPSQPFVYREMVAIPLNEVGFGKTARRLVDRLAGTDLSLTLYAHPNQAFASNDENFKVLDEFLGLLAEQRRNGEVEFCTMRQLAEHTMVRLQSSAA